MAGIHIEQLSDSMLTLQNEELLVRRNVLRVEREGALEGISYRRQDTVRGTVI